MIGSPLVLVPSSAAPVFDGMQGSTFELTLTASAVLTVLNPTPGTLYVFDIGQNAVGGQTIVYPANVHGAAAPSGLPNTRTIQTFRCGQDRTLYAASAGTSIGS